MTIKKIIKTSDGKYKVDEELESITQTSIVDKFVLERAIVTLKQEIADKQEHLDYKENLLKEINKI